MPIDLVHADDLSADPEAAALADAMFRDRAAQFRDRLGWKLGVDGAGRERDEYDDLNPLYLILSDGEGGHLASCRLMPSTGRTMMAEKFSHLTHGVTISSATVWEVTRFFVTPDAPRRAAAALMWAGCGFALRSGVDTYAGVTGAPLVPVFAACGWTPEVIGRQGDGADGVCACLWDVSAEQLEKLRRRAGLPENVAPPIPRFAPFAAASTAPAARLAA